MILAVVIGTAVVALLLLLSKLGRPTQARARDEGGGDVGLFGSSMDGGDSASCDPGGGDGGCAGSD